MNFSPRAHGTANAGRRALKPAVFVAVIGAIVAIWYFFGESLSLKHLAAREAELVAQGRAHPAGVVGAAFAIYVAATALSLPAAAVLSLVIAWGFHHLFGDVWGYVIAVVVVSFASTTGSTIAFLLSRYLFREAVTRRFGERLVGFNAALAREGALYLFTLRLIVAVPFFVINVVMGPTPIRVRTFWWVSQLGMLPGTCVYVYAGWSVPSLSQLAERGTSGVFTPNLVIAFALLGVFPLLVKRLIRG
jgi:uncharacterized membrane protein YdjX (TVP38/TMEM64 family)